MIKNRGKEKKDSYRSLSVDTIIESCLILMVLLLLTCARHLIVDCTALKSPHVPGHHFQQRPPGGALSAELFPSPPPTPPPPPSPSLNCLPSVTQSVTSPVIPSCVCKSWLFVLKHVNLVDDCRPTPQPPTPNPTPTSFAILKEKKQ